MTLVSDTRRFAGLDTINAAPAPPKRGRGRRSNAPDCCRTGRAARAGPFRRTPPDVPAARNTGRHSVPPAACCA